MASNISKGLNLERPNVIILEPSHSFLYVKGVGNYISDLATIKG